MGLDSFGTSLSGYSLVSTDRQIFLMAAHSLVSINENVVLNACAYLLYVKEKEKQHKKKHGSFMKGKNGY